MAGAPARYGMLQPPPPAVAISKAPSFKDVGFLLGGPDETAVPALTGPGWIFNATPQITPQVGGQNRPYKVAPRDIYLYNDPPDTPIGVPLFRMQAIVSHVPTQYGTDYVALGHYQPFKVGIPIRSIGQSGLVENSGFQPISRGPGLHISQTEVQVTGGPAAAARTFANTRFGLWFKAWVVGGANIRPLGSVQTPSPQFRGVLPNYGYLTLPRVIGS